MRNLLVTGGAGFIGSNFTRYMLGKYPDYRITVFDNLTYAGNLDNLLPVSENKRFSFVKGDIADREAVAKALQEKEIDTIVHFAAESHVDRSIMDPDAFIKTNVNGTYILLDEGRKHGLERFHHVSTDEVYGSISEGFFRETDQLNPRSPYAASKASSDLMVMAYHVTYGMNAVITRASNTFGPYQYPEKLLPLFISNALEEQPLPLYGDGKQVRDWLYVDDHCAGIDIVMHRGKAGEAYNLGGDNERFNINIVSQMLEILNKPKSLIKHVEDRPGHDLRYALDNSKIEVLGWEHSTSFEDALEHTVRWYVENEWWWRKIKGGEFKDYYQKQYGDRLKKSE